MDNQHRLIKGYRELNEAELAQMNAVKSLAASCGEMIEDLKLTDSADKRWVSIAATDLQTGFMAAVRAIAKPTTF
jgi:hypothetical protein